MTHPSDHDLLLTLNGKIDSILERLNGHVPTSCIIHDQKLKQLNKDMSAIKMQTKDGITSTRWYVTTGLAAIGLITAVWPHISHLIK